MAWTRVAAASRNCSAARLQHKAVDFGNAYRCGKDLTGWWQCSEDGLCVLLVSERASHFASAACFLAVGLHAKCCHVAGISLWHNNNIFSMKLIAAHVLAPETTESLGRSIHF